MQNIKRWISLALVVCLLAMSPAAALAEDTETGTGLPAESETVTSPSPSSSAAAEGETVTSPSPSASAAAESETVASPSPSASAVVESETVTSPSPSASAAEESETVTSPSPSASAAVESETVTFPSPSASAAAESETVTSPSPSASAAAEGESITSPSPSASTAAEESETVTSPSPSIEASISPSPSAETSSAPTDAAEVKTIASFEAVAPEGLSVPQGTPETGLGLPASLSVQFADGAAGEVAVAWQCAAGYDPSAEAGTQFAFAAVLPEGYALAEGVSLPQILVTLTPPLANAMLAAQASGDGWTLSDDGTLTVKGNMVTVDSGEIPPDIWNAVTSIEVTGDAYFILAVGMSFSGSVMVENGAFYNFGDLSGDVTVLEGESLFIQSAGKISGGVISGWVENTATISGGKFTGTVKNGLSGIPGATITGGDFTEATVVDKGGSVTGGVFNGFTTDSTTHTLTITGDIDLSTGTLAPLTIALDAVSKIVVDSGASFNAGDNTVPIPVECNGTITGGRFTGAITGGGAIAGGDFSGANLSGFTGTASSGTFAKFELSCDEEGNVTLTTTGSIDLTSDSDDIAPITLADVDALVISDRTMYVLRRRYGRDLPGDALWSDRRWRLPSGGGDRRRERHHTSR